MERLLAAAACFSGALLLAAPAEAGMTLCNRTADSVSVAVGYRDSARGWTAEGWWSVAVGDCQKLVSRRLTGSDAYLLVDGGKLPPRRSQSGGWFCTDVQRLRHPQCRLFQRQARAGLRGRRSQDRAVPRDQDPRQRCHLQSEVIRPPR